MFKNLFQKNHHQDSKEAAAVSENGSNEAEDKKAAPFIDKTDIDEQSACRVAECYADATPEIEDLFSHIRVRGSDAYYVDERGRFNISDRAFMMELLQLDMQPYCSITSIELNLLTGAPVLVEEIITPVGYGGWGGVSSFFRSAISYEELHAQLREKHIEDEALLCMDEQNWRETLRKSDYCQERLLTKYKLLCREIYPAKQRVVQYTPASKSMPKRFKIPKDLRAYSFNITFFGANISSNSTYLYEKNKDGAMLYYRYEPNKGDEHKSACLRLNPLEEAWFLEQLGNINPNLAEIKRQPGLVRVSYSSKITVTTVSGSENYSLSDEPRDFSAFSSDFKDLVFRRLVITKKISITNCRSEKNSKYDS